MISGVGPTTPRPKLQAVDFFCGAGGMTYGLARAGINVIAGIDNDPSCKKTYEHNNKPARFLEYDITELTPPDLAAELEISRSDENLIFAGCSPCQFWSKIKTDKTKSQRSAFLLREFQKFIAWFNPGFVVIENVPGLLTNKRLSILPEFLEFLDSKHYTYADDVVDALDYGVPQHRKRYLLIGTRVLQDIKLPRPYKNDRLNVQRFIGTWNGFASIKAGHTDNRRFMHTAAALSPENLLRIQATPADGGDRSSWKDNPALQIPAYEGKDEIFRDVYARMHWKKPAPTITTRFNSFSNGRFGHPEEDRAISLREGATLQTFPKTYAFKEENKATIARQIGNAVPPLLAERIGRHLTKIRPPAESSKHGC